MDYRERFSDPEEAQRVAMDGRQVQIWTAMPGIVTAVNMERMTVEVKPAIMGKQAFPNSTVKYVEISVVPDVPIIFPSAGGFTLTFPIRVGDECTLQFHSRCIDGWWQSGKVSVPLDSRIHDLSDATAHFGPKSLPKVLSDISTTNCQLRSDDGTIVIDLDPSGGQITLDSAKVEVGKTGGMLGVLGAAPIAKGTITGSASGALKQLLQFLQQRGDIVDSTT